MSVKMTKSESDRHGRDFGIAAASLDFHGKQFA